jgi:hypothetical protein
MLGMIAFSAFVAAQFLAVICTRGWRTANSLPGGRSAQGVIAQWGV